ncbi:hypothetical protein V555_03812 [Pseudomonas aeruginosa BWH054]|nr:putative transposase [Pseudomonas aeruginosa]ETV48658.1 hypothetical protein Q042_06737 [Pseudomonas aeruginosa BWHPSA037]EZO89579.1 hypothetical protein V555_05215 [Pseudomonas aeruginosa BWH054]ETV48850.1 hypothetical protein Q042_06624 [Pseudomonas aeruginosa BWHPSA037]ETV52424.1 hypothetical protein Q042_06512 [Pseudomonas aeruginosa BWHPSA037]
MAWNPHYTTKHKKKAPQVKESPFLGRATMTYNMGLPEPEKNFGVDLSTFWKD